MSDCHPIQGLLEHIAEKWLNYVIQEDESVSGALGEALMVDDQSIPLTFCM
jgi:hypothetical protein